MFLRKKSGARKRLHSIYFYIAPIFMLLAIALLWTTANGDYSIGLYVKTGIAFIVFALHYFKLQEAWLDDNFLYYKTYFGKEHKVDVSAVKYRTPALMIFELIVLRSGKHIVFYRRYTNMVKDNVY